MADQGFQEKTEQATPRRREDERKKGNVPRSKEITSAFMLMGAALGLAVLAPGMGRRMIHLQRETLAWLGRAPSDAADAAILLAMAGDAMVATLAPFLLALAGIALLIGFAQSGGAINGKALELKGSKLNPVAQAKEKYGWRALVNVAKQVLRVVLVGAVAWLTIGGFWAEMVGSIGREPEAIATAAYAFVLRLLGLTGAAYLLLALADYTFEYFEHEKKIMMTRQELKEEMKNSDGDPLLKQKIRDTMHAIARGRMMRDIPTADVVIANPTHRAVALRHTPEKEMAPIVVAMGERKLALRIRAIAEEHGIPVVEDRALAKALLRSATVGHPIPPTLWKAVAEILLQLYRARYRNWYGRPGAHRTL